MNIKPGVQTSELWYSVAAAIIGALIVYKLIDSEQADAWLALVRALIPALVPIVGSMWYTLQRTMLKREQLRHEMATTP